MAFREVDPGPAPVTGKFVKLAAIGDKLGGIYVGHEEAEGKFGTENRYSIRTKEGVSTISANYDLHRRMQKAIKDGLIPGHKVIITYSHDVPNQDPQKSAMRGHKVLVDTDAIVAPPPPKPADDVDF